MNKNKLVKLLFCLLFISMNWMGFAQTNPLTKRISIHATKQPIEKVLMSISTIGKIQFSYNPDIIPLDSIVTVSFDQTEIRTILQSIFSNKYSYKTTGQYIIIQRNKSVQQIASKNNATIQVKGSVVESGTGNKLANTSIYNINGNEEILTDANGDFSISFAPNSDNISLAVNNENYQDTIIFINSDTSETINISLLPKTILDSVYIKQIKEASKATIEQVKFVSSFLKSEMITHAKNIDFFTERPFQVSFLPYAGTNHKLSGSIVNKFSLNIISGYSYGVNGVEIGGIFNINRGDVRGVQISGFGNFTGNTTHGLQLAGFFNQNLGKVTGVQIAGFSNLINDTLDGIEIAGFSNVVTETSDAVQIAGFSNVTRNNMNGLQISGFSNFTKDLKGLQAAGFSNTTSGNLNGTQIAGFGNIVKDSTTGIQLAGFSNITKKEMNGVQIAGFLNYAKDVDGIQIGVINIADTVSGVSFGMFNFIRKGFHQISLKTTETGSIDLAINLGTTKFYNKFGVTAFPFSDTKTWGIEYGFGTLFLPQKKVNFNVELGVTNYNINTMWTENQLQTYKISSDLNYNPSQHFSIFVGPSFSMTYFDNTTTDISSLPKNTLFTSTYNRTIENIDLNGWIGLQAGLKYRF